MRHTPTLSGAKSDSCGNGNGNGNGSEYDNGGGAHINSAITPTAASIRQQVTSQHIVGHDSDLSNGGAIDELDAIILGNSKAANTSMSQHVRLLPTSLIGPLSRPTTILAILALFIAILYLYK
ncbi:hypothetical protein AYI70_g913 [Smittium culicis]|uniref:Uncharacterized protein n=1 Tax=Smittium culicis TaxID=133412 RepID=A0A1R1YFF3_9FUNG|nr:hypothetical protein AYI70_g913 [Smittium culicis]